MGAPFAPYGRAPSGMEGTPLTERELDVLDLLTSGKTNPEICAALDISMGTTKAHVQHILARLGVRNRVEATRWWFTL